MLLIKNKKAHHDYTITKTFHAGLVLSGSEVKSLRLKHGSLTGSYVKYIAGELFLLNAQINPYTFSKNEDYDPKRTRKLLMKKKEIYQLAESSDKKGWGIIPIAFELHANRIKLLLGVGKGKKLFEKRDILKKKAIQMDVARELKEKNRR